MNNINLWYNDYAPITDQDRRNLLILDCPYTDKTAFDWANLIVQSNQKGLFDSSTPTLMDALNKLAGVDPSDHIMPFSYDLNCGRLRVGVAYVNAGADDFNQACQFDTQKLHHSVCPSLTIAAYFKHFYDSYREIGRKCPQLNGFSQEQIEQIRTSKEYGTPRAEYLLGIPNMLDDYVYMWKRITDPKGKGLNHQWIDAYDAKYPEEKIKETMKELDVYANMPEERRPWRRRDDTEKTQEKSKQNLLTRAWQFIMRSDHTHS